MINYALYLFVNKGLGMSAGKIGAQVAQATAGTLAISDPQNVQEWWSGPGHHHAVYVMEARDSEHLLMIERYLNEREFKTYLMIDEGMTEIDALSPTVLGVEIINKDADVVKASFMTFKLYKDKKPERVEEKLKWWQLPSNRGWT